MAKGKGLTPSGAVKGPKQGALGGQAVVIGSKQFKNWTEAATWLHSQPKFVKNNLGYIKKTYPGLLKRAGYNVSQMGTGRWKVKTPSGNYWHFRGKELPWGGQNAPGLDTKPTVSTAPNWKPPPKRPGKPTKPKPPAGAGDPTMDNGQDSTGSGSDAIIDALAGATGIDPRVLAGLRAPNGKPLSLALAGKGARTMSPKELDALVSTIIQGDSRVNLVEKDIARMGEQNKHNVAQIGGWYDQVLASQAKAAERDKQFGEAAVQSATDVGSAILASIGGEAAEGAGMVGASTAANVGNLGAMETIQNQYNEDLRPILEGEKASQMTREQGAGANRLRDLNRQLVETRLQASADEANLRYNVWQQNNAILNGRLDRELAIRQYNAGLPQQRFQNQLTLAQTALAAQAQNYGQVAGTAAFAAGREDQAFNKAQAIRQWKASQQGKKGTAKTFAGLKPGDQSKVMDLVWNSIAAADADGNVSLRYENKKKAYAVAANMIQALGYSPKSPAVARALAAVLEQTYGTQ